MRTDTHIDVEDILNRKPFSEELVNGLLKNYVSGQDSLVIGLNGKWGLGKSTLFEFLKDEINKQTKEEEGRNYIIEFNPWSIFTNEGMHESFFRRLGVKLGNYNKQFEELKEYAKLVVNASKKANRANIEPKSKALIWFFTNILRIKYYDLDKQKEDVDERLKDENIKLFIFIDDIDRLQPKEIKEVFQLVKLNSNFKNTFFFIAFDKVIVKQAFKEEYGKLGESYLEKIVQLDYTLPIIADEDLSRLFNKEIKKVLNSIDLRYFEGDNKNLLESAIGNLWGNHLKFYITNIRHIVRFCNAIEVRLPIIYEDINIFDFLLLEILRLFDYASYEWIIKNQNSLIKFKEGGIESLRKSRKEGKLSASERLLELFEKSTVSNNNTKRIIEELFLHSNLMSEDSINDRLEREKRVASELYFEQYFSFKVLSTNIPTSLIDSYVEGDFGSRIKLLDTYKEKRLLRKFMRNLLFEVQSQGYKKKFDSYIKELFDYSDKANLVSYEDKYFNQSGWFIIISFLMDFSKLFNKDNGFTLFVNEAIRDSESYSRFLFLSTLRNKIEKVGFFEHIKEFPEEVLETEKGDILRTQEKGLLHFSELIKNGQDSLNESEQINVLKTLSRVKPNLYDEIIEEYLLKDENAVVMFKYSLTQENRSGVPKMLRYLQSKDYLMPGMSIEKLDERLSKIDKKNYKGNNKEYLELFYNLKKDGFDDSVAYSLDGEKYERLF